ncbi:hypothetical protein [Polaromonas sp. CG_9.11]|uniref:hypothetical protein n=1 Tax=Polaromonas sp. CG_9.11 TaxID=2787730 RepID=UPI0018CA0854|nr:hypothetical protein [Polaromonas sp. CG_9.11]MBG6074199.1 hypothetical protein [Polaromonas sp. CG_9.11]
MTRDAYISDAFRNHLASTLVGFPALDLKMQSQLASMVTQSAARFRQHSHMPGWASFSYLDLAKQFGREKFNQLNAQLKIFDVVDDWSKVQGRTKPYKLAAHVEASRMAFYSNLPTAPTKLLAGDGEIRHKPPTNALIAKRTTDTGTEVTRAGWSEKPVQSQVPVNVDELKRLEHQIQQETVTQTEIRNSTVQVDPVTAGYFLYAIRTVLHHANNTISPGCLIHKYQQSSSGRMYGQGINLQSVNRQVRYAALHGLWDYDIENCHYSILHQMAALAGLQCPVIEQYLNNKTSIRNGLATDLGLTPRQVKKVLLAMIYGASLSEDPTTAIPSLIGVEPARSLYEHLFFKALAADIAKARTVVLKNHRSFRGGLRNLRGLVMREAGKEARHKLAHLLQGVESVALEAAHNVCAERIVLLQHDGFTATTPDLNLALIEDAIFKATGYSLKISVSSPLKADFHAALINRD